MNLVWSDDPKDKKCPKCKQFLQSCQCQPEVDPKAYKWVAVLRLEKSGRGGKTVTVIDQLPKQELFLKDLCKELKNKCGTGGTYITSGKEGIIEIQGDKREQIRSIFEKKGYKVKGMVVILALSTMFTATFMPFTLRAEQPHPTPATLPKMTIKEAKSKCKNQGLTEQALIDCINNNTSSKPITEPNQ